MVVPELFLRVVSAPPGLCSSHFPALKMGCDALFQVLYGSHAFIAAEQVIYVEASSDLFYLSWVNVLKIV